MRNCRRKYGDDENGYVQGDDFRSRKYGSMGGGDKRIHLATWNDRGVFEEGAVNELREIWNYTLDVIAIQETKGYGTEIVKEGDMAFFKSGGKHWKRILLLTENLKIM